MSVYAKKTYPSKVYGEKQEDSQISYMNPYGKVNPPLNIMSLGNFCTVSNKSQNTLSTNGPLGAPKVLLFLPSVKASVNCLVFDGTSGNVQASSHLFSTMVKYGTSDTPLQAKCLRAALKIINTTNSTDRSSTVSILQISSPIDLEWQAATGAGELNLTSACAQNIVNMVSSHPRTATYSANYLANSKENCCVIGPSVGSGYNSYGTEPFLGPISDPNSRIGFDRSQKQMSMNNLIVVFPNSASVNDYLIQIMTQDALRFDANSLLGQMQKAGPVADNAERIKKIHDSASKAGGKLIDPDTPSASASAPTRKPEKPSGRGYPKPKSKGQGSANVVSGNRKGKGLGGKSTPI